MSNSTDDIVRKFDAVFGAAPQLVGSPQLAVPLALGNASPDAVKGIAGLAEGRKLAKELQDLDPEAEIARWNSLTKAQQSLSRVGGYKDQLDRHEAEKKTGWLDAMKMAVNPVNWAKTTASSVKSAIDLAWDYSVKPTARGVGDLIGHVKDYTVDPTAASLGSITPDPVEHAVGGAVTSALDSVTSPLLSAGKTAGGALIDIYGHATSGIDQFYRANVLAKQDGVNGIGRVPLPGAQILDMVKWWDDADRDNAPVMKSSLADVEEEYGQEVVGLVREQQKDPEALLNRRARFIAAGDTENAQALDDWMNAPEFKEVQQRLENALISPGRTIGQTLHLEDNTEAFNLVSGLGDGTWRVVSDPLLLAGKAVQGARIARYGIAKDAPSAEREVARLFQNKNVNRYFDQIGPHLDQIKNPSAPGARSEAIKTIERNFKEINPALREGMVKFGVNDAKSAQQYLTDGENFLQLLGGNAAARRPLMPYRTAVGAQLQKSKKLSGGVIDFFADGNKILKDDLLLGASAYGDELGAGVRSARGGTQIQVAGSATPGYTATSPHSKEIADQLDMARRGFRGRMATAHRRMTTKLPELDETKRLDLMAPGASQEVQRIAAMFAPRYWSREISAAFSAANEAGRKNIVKGLYATMAEGAGITKTVEGQKWLKGYLRSFDDAGVGTYSITDGMKLKGGEDAGIVLADASPALPVPNFAEFHAQAAKIAVADNMFNAVNRPMLDWYMQSVWRPSVLLRPALATRNSIEETLNQFVREPSAVMQGEAFKRVANRRQFGLKREVDADSLEAGLRHAEMNAAFIADHGFDAATGVEKVAAMRARAAELRKERQGAGIKASERPRTRRQIARGDRKAQADRMDAKADAVQSRLNALESVRNDAAVKAARSDANPNAFDTEMGRLFRTVTSIPRAMGRTMAPVAERTTNPHLREIVEILKDPNRGLYNFYRANIYGRMSEAILEKANPELLKIVDELVENPAARKLFDQRIMETSQKSVRNEIDFLPKRANPGEFGPVSALGDEGAEVWSLRLQRFAADDAGRHILAHLDDPMEAVLGAAKIVERNKAYGRLRKVDEAGPRGYAVALYKEIAAHLSTSEKLVDGTILQGGFIDDITKRLSFVDDAGVRQLNEEAISASALRKVDDLKRPPRVIGQDGDLIDVRQGPMQNLVQNGFELIGNATAVMSRQRQFFSNYVEFRQLTMPLERDLVAKLGGDEVAQKIVAKKLSDEALQMAVNRATSFVDNPAVRSQAAVLLRNFAPFYRAQEEFFARWAKTMKYNPESWGRAFLGMHAANASGLIHKDDNGDLYFMYPGSGAVHGMMADISQKLGWDITKLPIVSPMTGKLQMLTPGFNPDGTIHIFNGPILAEPLRQLARMTSNPTIDEYEKKLLGPGAGRGFIHANLVPAILRPAYEEYALGDEKHSMNAMAAMYANGQGLPPNATPKQKQDFLDTVKRHSNGLKLMRSIFGPALPAYPRIEPEQKPSEAAQAAGDSRRGLGSDAPHLDSVRSEFYDLVKRTGSFELAYQFWMKEHPDEIPFIVGATEAAGSAPISSTMEAGKFIEDNRTLLRNYPQAAPFFIPQGTGDFDAKAYALSLEVGLREAKPIKDFLDDLTMSDSLSFYYREREKADKHIADAKASGNTESARHWGDVWSEWSKGYKDMNPLVAEYTADGGRRAYEREATFKELKTLLDSGNAPAGPTTDIYRKFVAGWDKHQFNLGMIEGTTAFARSQKTAEKAAWDEWATRLTKDNPAASLLYGKLFKWMD